MKITSGKIHTAQKVLIYGPPGIGKTTLASQFPDPIFIDTEGGTKNLDVRRFEAPSSYQMLLDEIQYVKQHPDTCKTLVIDTIDWAEKLEIRDLCRMKGWSGIEDAGYGKGYTYSAEEIAKMLNLLTEVVDKYGINAVLTAHAQLRKVEMPEEMGAYDHWETKTSKQVSSMISEWADMILFCNYKIRVVKVDSGAKKAQGGQRMMYTTHTPFWTAKNRFGLPDELPMDYKSIAHIFADADPKSTAEPEPPKPPEKTAAKVQRKADPKPATKPEPVPEHAEEVDKRIPKALRDLMIASGVGEWDVKNICEAKGYVPHGTEIWDYDRVNPGFIEGALVANWQSVCDQIMKMRIDAQIPFD